MRAGDIAPPQSGQTPSGQYNKPVTYSPIQKLPKTPHVRLVFQGLLWFIFHGTDECQVGVVNTTHGPMPHDRPHDLDIRVWEIDAAKNKPCPPPKRFHIGDPKSITSVQIDVNRPAVASKGVHCYEGPESNSQPKTYDAKDWRWVIDFERWPLYPTGIRLDESKINPGISINHGVFYTLAKTTSKFDFAPDNRDDETALPGTYVALLAAADIELEREGDVTLVIRRAFPSTSFVLPPLPYSDSIRYQIDIRNICMVGNKPCPRQERNPVSDFYLFNETFTRPVGAPLYTLKKHYEPPGVTRSFRLPDDICGYKDDQYIRSNNEAPCGPVCAGGGGGG